MNPLLSIIIATKNRQKYAVSAVESILSIEDDRIQVVIQDNSDVDSLSFDLEKYKADPRLVYRYTPPPFSSIDNFNAAIELSTGEYICLIGDDDGINPEILIATEWAKNNNVDALVGSLSANYRWEGTGAPNTLFTKMTGGTLTITHFTGALYEADIEKSLDNLMANGCTNYLDFDLPKLYHGIVKRQCMETIKTQTGAYLKGLSPDIYSSISLACIVNKLVMVDYPISIPGVCGASTSITEGQIKKHSKKLEDAPHFRDRGSYDWSVEVPRIYCVQTIWADSGFAALREMKRFDLIEKFKSQKLYANIIAADWSLRKEIDKHLLLVNNGNVWKSIGSYSNLFAALWSGPGNVFLRRRVLGRLKIILGTRTLVDLNDLDDITKAMAALKGYLISRQFSLKNILSKSL